MKRREFITLIGGTAAIWPQVGRAQRAQKAPIVGFLHPGSPEGGSVVLDSLREGFRELGYVEGESIILEARWARGKPEALPQLTQELIQLGVDVLVPTARPPIEAARAATCRCRNLHPVGAAHRIRRRWADVASYQTDLLSRLRLFRSRATLEAEILVLRQQIIVLRQGR